MKNSELTHHGIKGQRWGVRRYQNKDGTLTNVGKKRYSQMVNDVRGNLDKAFADAEQKYQGNKEHESLLRMFLLTDSKMTISPNIHRRCICLNL